MPFWLSGLPIGRVTNHKGWLFEIEKECWRNARTIGRGLVLRIRVETYYSGNLRWIQGKISLNDWWFRLSNT